MRALWELDHALRSRSKRMLQEHGVTGPQRLVLRVVGARPGLTAGDLADALQVHPSTLTAVLARLQRRGLLVMRTDPRDARRKVLQLAARGKKVNAARAGTVEAAVVRALASVTARDVAATRAVLASLVRELEDS